nr:MAG TPA: hypothetical protein [Caudoviricetes sp.]
MRTGEHLHSGNCRFEERSAVVNGKASPTTWAVYFFLFWFDVVTL